MSCLSGRLFQAKEPNCPCDRFFHPPDLYIQAGLDTIPRQVAALAGFRRAMLADLHRHHSLTSWRGRNSHDLGCMLLEMWAYICDSLTFYDEVIAHECYLRTARLCPSLRKLVGLLGYLPSPAVASVVKLALIAEGRKGVALPAGMAFRSGGFDGEPPQVFELDRPKRIHPFLNCWSVKSGRTVLGKDNPDSLLINPAVKLTEGSPLLILPSDREDLIQVRTIDCVSTYTGIDNTRYTKVDFRESLSLPGNMSVKQIKLLIPTRTVSIIKPPAVGIIEEIKMYESGFFIVILHSMLVLTTLISDIKPQEYVIVSRHDKNRWFRVFRIDEGMYPVGNDTTVTINQSTFKIPGISVPVTNLILDTLLDDERRKEAGDVNWWDRENQLGIIVHYGLTGAGEIVLEPHVSLRPDGPISLKGPLEVPEDGNVPQYFQFEDKNQSGIEAGGVLDYARNELRINSGTSWKSPLVHPVNVFGNIVSASRGESVIGEILGSGDASIPNQSFKLRKKPLTYLPAPTADNDKGVKSTLSIFVNGILWEEVRSFYNTRPDDQVYILRQNDDGESVVTFGNGQHGMRVPSGRNNIKADYRYGAGALSPPAGSITRLAKPVKGVKAVKNLVAAAGGDDAESTEKIRTCAPASALILGRIVSIRDVEAAAMKVGGVRAVQVEWRWHKYRQRPVIQLWYIGEPGIEIILKKRLLNLSDPTVMIEVEQSEGITASLSIAIETDKRFLDTDVLNNVRFSLMDKEKGLLPPERIGIGKPLFRSRIFETVMGVEGVKSIKGIMWNGAPFNSFAKRPDAGQYFNFEGRLHLPLGGE